MIFRLLLFFYFLVGSLSVDARAIYITVRGVTSASVKVKKHLQDTFFIVKNVDANQLVKFDIGNLEHPCILDVNYEYQLHSNRVEKSQRIIAYKQDIFLSVNPSFLHQADSTIFQLDEIENNVLKQFKKEVQARSKKLKVLHHFIFNYPIDNDPLFSLAIANYEQEVSVFNQWIDTFTRQYKQTLVSTVFDLHRWHQVDYKCPLDRRLDKILSSFMDNKALKDSSIYMFDEEIKNYLDSYVFLATKKSGDNMMETSKEDVLVRMCSKAIDTISKYNPTLLTFIVDYFYEGFSQAHMMKGIASMSKYGMSNDYHGKFKESLERVSTQTTVLQEGLQVPDIELDKNMSLHHIPCHSSFKILVFWSADCEHCIGTMNTLHDLILSKKLPLSVIAYSIDESEIEVNKWKNLKDKYSSFDFHFRGEAGINSKAARSFGIISTPTMILIDAQNNSISYLPKNIESLIAFLEKQNEH